MPMPNKENYPKSSIKENLSCTPNKILEMIGELIL